MVKQKTLKDAIKEDDLESFIKEHEDDDPGDLDKVEEVIRKSDKTPDSNQKPEN